MEIKKVTIDNREYEFVNSSRDTRSGFAHDCTLFCNGSELVKNSCHYLNRTWECYRYQTVMKGAVRMLMDRVAHRRETIFRANNNIKRMTAEKREELNRLIENDPTYISYKKLYEKI